MKSMAISLFKAHALETIGNVASYKESIVITNRGKPVAKVIPFQPTDKTLAPGRLTETLVFENDIISPIKDVSWEANR